MTNELVSTVGESKAEPKAQKNVEKLSKSWSLSPKPPFGVRVRLFHYAITIEVIPFALLDHYAMQPQRDLFGRLSTTVAPNHLCAFPVRRVDSRYPFYAT